MESNLKKIQDLLAASPLPQEDSFALIALLARAPDKDLGPLASLFAEDPSWIQKISNNYKHKLAAVAADSPKMWEKIIQEEEQTLRGIAE